MRERALSSIYAVVALYFAVKVLGDPDTVASLERLSRLFEFQSKPAIMEIVP